MSVFDSNDSLKTQADSQDDLVYIGTKLEDDSEESPPFQAGARWTTIETYKMRRIFPMKDRMGNVTGYRPMIQQGRGKTRKTHSAVFRITEMVDSSMAMAMAQDWRDKKEVELGISSGQISAKSASRFAPGISLVVSTKEPYRAYWKWAQKGYSKVTVYMGEKKGYQASYLELVNRISEQLGSPAPKQVSAPYPQPTQYARLFKMGIKDLPDRRATSRSDRAAS